MLEDILRTKLSDSQMADISVEHRRALVNVTVVPLSKNRLFQDTWTRSEEFFIRLAPST